MAQLEQIKRDLHYLRSLLRIGWRIRHVKSDMTETAADIIEHWAAKTPDAIAILFEDQCVTYAEYNDTANRYAHWARAQGLKQGDAVALLMENRPEYLMAWLGMAKIGVATALINTNLTGHALAHSLNISGANHIILGTELGAPLDTARPFLERSMTVFATREDADTPLPPETEDLDATLAAQPASSVGREARAGLGGKDVCFYIYTSGTTGLPKAAKFTHARLHTAMNGFSAAVGSTASDRVYITLPLYHSAGGVAGLGVALTVGGTVIIRRKFSVSHFWDDVAQHNATIFQYIGELCRYLVNAPSHPHERSHKLRAIIGNGLRPEIWEEFQSRFAIPHIVEFYGSTEGNVTLFNLDGKAGAVGRVPGYAKGIFPVNLVHFDVETEQPVRGTDGFCIPCKDDEVGEGVGRIGEKATSHFDGYSNEDATSKKVLRHVFEEGDLYFRTGDLLRRDRHGYYYFVDRIGDTFRWKGENVATSEVAEAISRFPGVREANVYGVHVPHTDGRAGMVSLVADEGFDLDGFHAFLAEELPAYARPIFLRLQTGIEITGTFKHRKVDLVKEGFDPTQITEPLFLRDDKAGGFVPLTLDLFQEIEAGTRMV